MNLSPTPTPSELDRFAQGASADDLRHALQDQPPAVAEALARAVPAERVTEGFVDGAATSLGLAPLVVLLVRDDLTEEVQQRAVEALVRTTIEAYAAERLEAIVSVLRSLDRGPLIEAALSHLRALLGERIVADEKGQTRARALLAFWFEATEDDLVEAYEFGRSYAVDVVVELARHPRTPLSVFKSMVRERRGGEEGYLNLARNPRARTSSQVRSFLMTCSHPRVVAEVARHLDADELNGLVSDLASGDTATLRAVLDAAAPEAWSALDAETLTALLEHPESAIRLLVQTRLSDTDLPATRGVRPDPGRGR